MILKIRVQNVPSSVKWEVFFFGGGGASVSPGLLYTVVFTNNMCAQMMKNEDGPATLYVGQFRV
jgi:hypothetical protein